MTEKLLLVDFENVHQVDLSRLDESFKVGALKFEVQHISRENVAWEITNN